MRAVSSRSWQRLDGVDLLRGLSIVLVLLNHVNMQLLFAHVPYTRGWPVRLVLLAAWSGQYGVQMFFAVSGFLITSTSLRRWGTLPAVRLREFYGLRVARIAPLLLALLLVLSVLDLAQVPGFVVKARDGGLANALFAALTFHVNWLEAHRGYLPGAWDVLWSLSVEETFYALFPLVCRVVRGVWLVGLLGALAGVGPFGRTLLAAHNPVWREYSYLGSMDAIAMGCLAALAVRRLRPGRKAAAMGIGGGLLIACVLCRAPFAAAFALARIGLDMTTVALGACLWSVASAAWPGRAPRVLRPVAWLGRQSYEVYLTHMAVVLGVFAVFRAAGSPVNAWPLLFAAVVALAAVLGGVTARWFAEPANRMVRRWFGEGPARMGEAREQAVGSLAGPAG